MAHKKGAGSTRNGRDSHSKRLGVKLFGGQAVDCGNIIIRQRGTKFHPGEGVGMGKDHTIFAMIEGVVVFRRRKNNKTYVNVMDRQALVKTETAPVKKVKAPVKDEEKTEEATEAVAETKAEVQTEVVVEETQDTSTDEQIEKKTTKLKAKPKAKAEDKTESKSKSKADEEIENPAKETKKQDKSGEEAEN